jgi:sugar/nucleoside kinase (ribokinase family)
MSKLLIVGTVAFDAIQTPFGSTDKILGGAATYIGLSAAYFKVPSGIVSVVGGDFPTAYLQMLQDKNIDILVHKYPWLFKIQKSSFWATCIPWFKMLFWNR